MLRDVLGSQFAEEEYVELAREGGAAVEQAHGR